MVVQHFCLYRREENAGQRLLQYSCSFTHSAAGCQQPEMNLCSSGTWKESFFRGGNEKADVQFSPSSSIVLHHHCSVDADAVVVVVVVLFPDSFCPQLLLVYTWAEGLGFVLVFFGGGVLSFFSKCLFCSWYFVFCRALIKANYIIALRTLVGAFCC